MRYAKMRIMDISNGSGIGVSLFVQGCHFHCPGCFNQETWDFSGGKEWLPHHIFELIRLASKPYIKRISILGGEPLADENVVDILQLIQKIREELPNIEIWLYTGFTIEEIFSKTYPSDQSSSMREEIVRAVDVLVDGRFDRSKQDFHLKWRGSSNQRVIDVRKSEPPNKLVEID